MGAVPDMCGRADGVDKRPVRADRSDSVRRVHVAAHRPDCHDGHLLAHADHFYVRRGQDTVSI